MRPFTVSWPEADVEQLRARVREYRFPPAPEAAGWRYGCDPDYLRELCTHWMDGFGVSAAERCLNRFPQVIHCVEGLDIHAVHVVGEAGGRRPLLLSHGWPGSVFEFWEVAEPLAFPSRFGGRVEDAFAWLFPRCRASVSPASRPHRSAPALRRVCSTH